MHLPCAKAKLHTHGVARPSSPRVTPGRALQADLPFLRLCHTAHRAAQQIIGVKRPGLQRGTRGQHFSCVGGGGMGWACTRARAKVQACAANEQAPARRALTSTGTSVHQLCAALQRQEGAPPKTIFRENAVSQIRSCIQPSALQEQAAQPVGITGHAGVPLTEAVHRGELVVWANGAVGGPCRRVVTG